jgi:hypothetical protein
VAEEGREHCDRHDVDDGLIDGSVLEGAGDVRECERQGGEQGCDGLAVVVEQPGLDEAGPSRFLPQVGREQSDGECGEVAEGHHPPAAGRRSEATCGHRDQQGQHRERQRHEESVRDADAPLDEAADEAPDARPAVDKSGDEQRAAEQEDHGQPGQDGRQQARRDAVAEQ